MTSPHDTVPFSLDSTERLLVRSKQLGTQLVSFAAIKRLQRQENADWLYEPILSLKPHSKLKLLQATDKKVSAIEVLKLHKHKQQ